jgi:ribonucleoside-diphosphate reductase alpha chain
MEALMSYKFSPENPFKSEQTAPESHGKAAATTGLKMEHFFSTPGVHPFDDLEWETRSAKITGDGGRAIFEQDNIEVPASWSQLATKVVASKYFYGDVESGRREHSLKQLVHRVCKMIADRGRKDGYLATDEDAETFYNGTSSRAVLQPAKTATNIHKHQRASFSRSKTRWKI